MHAVLSRVQRRAGRLLREWVPYRRHYRPVGVHASSAQLAQQAGSGATYNEIEPAHTSTLELPAGFYECAADFSGLHGKPNATEQLPAAFVLTLRNGRVYADNPNSVAIISADNRLVGDVSFQYGNSWNLAQPEHNNIFRQQWFVAPTRIEGTVFSLLSGGGAASGNYYHWLVDSLPRLHLLQEAGLLGSVDYFLVYNRNHGFVRESLAHLGIGPERIIDVETHRHVQATQLIATTSVRGQGTHVPRWASDYLRAAFLPPDAAVASRFGPLVYISRRDASMRLTRNEAEVEKLLHGYGFETHVLSPYSFAEKVALFAGARVVVGPVGAGLANLVFCPTGASVIELFSEHFVVADYLDLATKAGMHYQFLVSTLGALVKDRRQAWEEDLLIDVDALRARVEPLVAAKQQLA
ncbi:glycosyltransferase family 61 protein [Hymenobacter oligotrophus]|uniref:Glycosyltransferase family 61 protein n=1 Tax=Hymenobacter oligotrophus TaxID=2319843 RepID=A0A3B7R053_9BACT|nr:glycosyltransferase 61 family protein [Hymenobacter oligotrophus]AYA36883.1 glycosyltransferase family 61 protein [Hymenobacter oligotrophus]